MDGHSPLSALHHSLLRTALGRCFSSAFVLRHRHVLYSAAPCQCGWGDTSLSGKHALGFCRCSLSALITRPVLLFVLPVMVFAYRYGFAACASVAKLKVEAPRPSPWADRSVNLHTCNPQHRPGKDTDGGRRMTDDARYWFVRVDG